MSNLYDRRSGIRPSPLFKEHLLPSNPPPSATKSQLALFSRVLARRSNQLNLLPLESLQAAYELLTEDDKPTAKELKDLLKGLPQKKPSDNTQYISLVRYLLVENFHTSIDTRRLAEVREESLKKVKHIFSCLDLAYLDFSETEGAQDSQKQAAVADTFSNSTANPEKQRRVSSDSQNQAGSNNERRKGFSDEAAEVRALVAEAHRKAKEKAQNESANTTEAVARTTVTAAAIAAAVTKNPTTLDKTKENKGREAKVEHIKMGMSFSKGGRGTGVDDAIEIIDDDNSEKKSKEMLPREAPSRQFTPEDKVVAPEKKDLSIPPKVNMVQKEVESTKSHAELLTYIETKKDKSRRAYRIQRRSNRLAFDHKFRGEENRAQFHFAADKKINSGFTSSSSIDERSSVVVQWINRLGEWNDKSLGYIEGPELDDLSARFSKWDPFWRVVNDFSLFQFDGAQIGYTTSKITCYDMKGYSSDNIPLSACRIRTNLSQAANTLTWGHRNGGRYQNHDTRLLLRALPLVVPAKYKKYRSDSHLWPKATFINFFHDNKSSILPIQQRREQSHDRSLWKSMCHMLDVTPYITNPRADIDLAICTRDSDIYNFQLAMCKYMSPKELLNEVMGDGPRSIVKLTPDEGRALVKQNLEEKDTVNLDSDDEDGGDNGLDLDSIYLTCSLLCSVSMKAINIPVRGMHCKHMQCFDLANYIATHSTVHGGRWRCAVCDEFVAVQDLMVDGFIAEILDKIRHDVNSSRDKVEIYRDGTWKFLDENKLRYQKKRSSTSEQPENKRAKTNANDSNIVAQAEVIDILDDDD